MTSETLAFDAAPYLTDQKAQAELIADALSSGEAGYIAAALGVIARARGMTEVARAAGVSRTSLYKALAPDGDPQLSTLLGVLRALNLKLEVRAPETSAAE